MEQSRRVVKNIFWLALEPGLRLLVAIPLAGFVAHQLGVTGYGEFNFALSFVVLFGVIANLGLTEVLLRSVAREPPDLPKLWSSVLAVKGVLLVLYLAVLGGVALAVGYSSTMIVLILLLGTYQGLLSLDNTARGVFGGNQQMKAIAGLGSFKTIAEVGVTVAVLLLGAKVTGLAVSRVGLGAAGLIFTVYMTSRHFGVRLTRPSMALAIPLIAPGMSFAVIAALRALNARAGFLVLERFRGVDEVALFSAAMAPVDRIFLFLPAIEVALFPFFSAIREDEEERFGASLFRAFRYQSMMAGGLGVAVSLLGPWLLRLVFPIGFHPAGLVLEVLGIGVAVKAMNNLLTTAVAARGGERTIGWITGVQCVVNVGVALALVASMGAVGLAWGIGLSEGAMLLLLMALLARRGTLKALRVRPLLGPTLAALGLFLVLTLIPGGRVSMLWPLVFAAAYPFLLFATGDLGREDLVYFAALAQRGAKG